MKNNLSILTYHDISNEPKKGAVSIQSFREQVEYLAKQHIRVLDLDTFLAVVSGAEKLEGRAVLITFDDGYKGVFERALPILKKYNMPAVMFVTPEFVGTKGKCTKVELQGLAKNNIAIANHGFSHKQMAMLSHDEAVEEYIKAKRWLDKHIATNCFSTVFAPPKGNWSDKIEHALSEVGMRAVLKQRIDVYGDKPLWYFKMSLRPIFQWLRKNKSFVYVVFSLIALKIILGIVLLLGVPDVGIGNHFFVPAGGDDTNYVLAARQLLDGDLKVDSMIGYPLYLALLMLVTGVRMLPQLAFSHTLMSLFVIELLSLILVMCIVRQFWKSIPRMFFAGLVFIMLPYMWWLMFGDLTLTTESGALGLIGLTRTQQLFGLPLLADGLGALFFSGGLLVFLAALSRNQSRLYALAGFLVGISGIIRIQNLLLLAALGFVLILLFRWRFALWFSIAGAIALIPQLITNTFVTGVPYIFSNYSRTYNESFTETTYGIQNLIAVPTKIYSYSPTALVLCTALALLVIWATLSYFRNKKDIFYVMLFVGILSPTALFIFESSVRNPRYFLPFLSLFIVAVIATYARLFLKESYK